MRILVTGRAGSGKTAVASELTKRGYSAFDTDKISHLSSWRNKKTKDLIQFTDNRYVDLKKYEWVWDRVILESFLRNSNDIFICGGASNDFDFEDLFSKHFVLDVSPDIQINRLTTRSNNDYGKDPRMFEAIIQGQFNHVSKARSLGITLINADSRIEEVVDRILDQL